MAKGLLERMFKLSERNTTVRTEVIGGATTFLTMAYIIVVNPAILSFAGIPVGPSTVATILAAVFGSLADGALREPPDRGRPLHGRERVHRLWPGGDGIGWQQRLGAVFVRGSVFSSSRCWECAPGSPIDLDQPEAQLRRGNRAIPRADRPVRDRDRYQLRYRDAAAALLSRRPASLRAPDVPVKIGNLHGREVLLAIVGFLVIVTLLYRGCGAPSCWGSPSPRCWDPCWYGAAPRLLALPFLANTRLRRSHSSSTSPASSV